MGHKVRVTPAKARALRIGHHIPLNKEDAQVQAAQLWGPGAIVWHPRGRRAGHARYCAVGMRVYDGSKWAFGEGRTWEEAFAQARRGY